MRQMHKDLLDIVQYQGRVPHQGAMKTSPALWKYNRGPRAQGLQAQVPLRKELGHSKCIHSFVLSDLRTYTVSIKNSGFLQKVWVLFGIELLIRIGLYYLRLYRTRSCPPQANSTGRGVEIHFNSSYRRSLR